MPLKFKCKSKEEIPAEHLGLYIEREGAFVLDVEGAADKARLDDLVENAADSLRAIDANLSSLDASALVRVHRADALRFMQDLPAHAYDVAFADPPYDLGLAAQVAERWLVTPFADVLGVEHRAFEKMPDGGDRRRYGGTAITVYRRDDTTERP